MCFIVTHTALMGFEIRRIPGMARTRTTETPAKT
jgi:hypothetical protein